MQLSDFYLSIIQITLIDALAIGAGAGMLASTFFGIKLKRMESNAFSWFLGGIASTAFGTIVGYYIMNILGYFTAWSGSTIQGLAGADLIEWVDTLAVVFAPYQIHAVGFAMFGALLGIGLGYGIGSHPDDTSIIGNLIAIFGIISIFCGLLLTILQNFIMLSLPVAITYLVLFNGLTLIGYGIAIVVNMRREDAVQPQAAQLQD